MENKELYRREINDEVVDILETDNSIEFLLKSGEKVSLSTYHGQDCCENVWADFSVIKHYRQDLVGKKFKDLVIKAIKSMGFLLCFYADYEESVKIFIPCYNEQNGYYSSDLELLINQGMAKIDISEFVEDKIN